MDYREEIARLVSGGCCAEVMVRLGLALKGEENPLLVMASSGLCIGMVATPAFCTNLTRLMTFSSAACIGIAAIVFLFYPLKPAVMDKIYAEKAAKATDLLGSK